MMPPMSWYVNEPRVLWPGGWHHDMGDTGGAIMIENQSVIDYGMILAQCSLHIISSLHKNSSNFLKKPFGYEIWWNAVSDTDIFSQNAELSLHPLACMPNDTVYLWSWHIKKDSKDSWHFYKKLPPPKPFGPFLMTSNDLLWMKACNQIQEIETLHVRKP